MYLVVLTIFLSIINQCWSIDSYHVQLNDVDLNSCHEDASLFHILSFNLWSDQLQIPGDLDVSLSFRLSQNYSVLHATYSVQFERKFGPFWMNIPCLTNTCSDQSLCTLIKHSCSSTKSCEKTCQLSSGSHTLEHIRLPLKQTFFRHKIFTNGQYKFQIKLSDDHKTTIGCFNGYVTLEQSD